MTEREKLSTEEQAEYLRWWEELHPETADAEQQRRDAARVALVLADWQD